MANEDISVRHQPSPTPTATTGEVIQVTDKQTSSQPPVEAPITSSAADSGLAAPGGPTLASPTRMNPADLMTLLYALRKKTSESRIKNAEEGIKNRALDKQMKNEDTLEKLKKIAHHHQNKTGGILAKVFAWVGVALAFVVAAVVGVVSGGAAAAPLFALALVSTAVLIAEESGGMEKMEDAMGMDDKQKMAFSISLTVALLVLNIGATVATGGVSGITSVVSSIGKLMTDAGEAAAEGAAAAAEGAAAASETAAAASEGAAAVSEGAAAAAEGATEVSQSVAETSIEGSTQLTEETTSATESADEVAASAGKSAKVLKAANRLRAAAQITSGATSIAGGGIGIDTAKKEYETTTARADMMRNKAELAKLAAMDEEDMRRIKKLIQQLQDASGMVIDTLSSADEAATKIRTSI